MDWTERENKLSSQHDSKTSPMWSKIIFQTFKCLFFQNFQTCSSNHGCDTRVLMILPWNMSHIVLFMKYYLMSHSCSDQWASDQYFCSCHLNGNLFFIFTCLFVYLCWSLVLKSWDDSVCCLFTNTCDVNKYLNNSDLLVHCVCQQSCQSLSAVSNHVTWMPEVGGAITPFTFLHIVTSPSKNSSTSWPQTGSTDRQVGDVMMLSHR